MRILLAIFLLPFFLVSLEAKPIDLTNENVSLNVADDWQVVQRPVAIVPTSAVPIFSAANPANTTAVTVMLCSNPQQVAVTYPDFIVGIKSSISSSAANKGNAVQFNTESAIDLNGVPAYEIGYGLTVPGPKLVVCHAYMVAANQKLYLIMTQTMDPDQAPALEAMASSFRFASPPEIPKTPIRHRRLKLALLACAAIGGVVLVAGAGFYFLRKRE